MEKKKSEFDKVFSAWDILVIAFGAMIGWGWVVSTGDWIGRGGVLGAVIGFAIGGIMVFFVGLTLSLYGRKRYFARETIKEPGGEGLCFLVRAIL